MNNKHNYIFFFLLTIFLLPVTFVSADPIMSPNCNKFIFDASASSDPDNTDISYHWEFGDGETSDKAVSEHTYSKSGDYNVTLTITDGAGLECSTATVSQTVRANIPPHVSFTANELVCVNQPIAFDGSSSYDDSKSKLSYEWNFGDGSNASGEPRVSKVFSKGGDYTVTLTVDDNSQAMCSSQNMTKKIHVNAPPVADAGEKTILKCIHEDSDLVINFDGSSSSDVNQDQLSYLWDFGDGTKAETMQSTHSYEDVGNYEVKLIVKDNTALGCGTSVDFITVKLNKAPIAEAGAELFACAGEDVLFDGSKSYSHKKGTLAAQWFFGDGTEANTLKVKHSYTKPGKYQAKLTVENALNPMCPASSDTRVVTINSTPSVDIKSVDKLCLGSAVHFDVTASDPDGDNLEYYWSFGDGTVLKGGPKTSHNYQQGGNYRVTVVVDDGHETNCSTATATKNIKVNTPPIANAGPNLACCVNKETFYNASASSDPDGDSLTYTRDFGDGQTANGSVAKHTYENNGSYNVILTVDDNSGTTCSKSTAGFVARANSKPIPVMNIR